MGRMRAGVKGSTNQPVSLDKEVVDHVVGGDEDLSPAQVGKHDQRGESGTEKVAKGQSIVSRRMHAVWRTYPSALPVRALE